MFDGNITIGLTASLTGKYKNAGKDQLNGVEMWVQDINERGALLGKEVKLVVYDDKSDAQNATALYKKLIIEDGVDLLLGPYSSDITSAVSQVVNEYELPLLAIAASSNKIWENVETPYVFGTYVQSDKLMKGVIELAKKQGLSKLAILSENSSYTRSIGEGAKVQAKVDNLDLVFESGIGNTALSLRKMINLLVQSNADIVIIGAYYENSVKIVKAIKSLNFRPKLLAFSGSIDTEAFKRDLGDDVEGILSSVQWSNSQRMPGAKDFNFRYRRKYGVHPSYQAAGGYAAGQILEAAVRLARSWDKTKIQEQLLSLKFRSLFGHYRVGKNGEQIGKSPYVMQWQDGERRLVLPANLASHEIRFFNSNKAAIPINIAK